MRCCSLHACLLRATDLLMQDWPVAAVGRSHCSRSTVLNLSMSLSVTSQRLATAAGQPAVHTQHWPTVVLTRAVKAKGQRKDLLLAVMLARQQIQAADVANPAGCGASDSTTAHEQQQGVMLTC